MNSQNLKLHRFPAESPPERHARVNSSENQRKPDLEARRRSVLSLRLRRMSEPEIADVLGVSQPTVSRDLHWIRKQWGATFGAGQLRPEDEIGEAVALFEEVERMALVECDGLSQTADPATARARMKCLRTAMEARQRRINLLHDLGFFERRSPKPTINADELRDWLRSEGLLSACKEGDELAAEGDPWQYARSSQSR